MANNEKDTRNIVDVLSTRAGYSRVHGSITDVYRGIDHRDAGSPFQKNNDHQGLVLFTRPRLNLTYNNVMADRQLRALLSEEPYSMYRAIRCMLDPELSKGRAGREIVKSAVFDERQAFMPLLSNTLLNLSGFPDITSNTYTSTEGKRKESYSIIDDVAEVNGAYDVTANFANIKGDPITAMFHFWTRYAGNVYSGDMVPYPEAIVENEIDYQTRIWRIVLDSSKRYVTKIGCASAAFPMASPLGAAFNYNREEPFISENDQISVPFRCMGAEYNDPILYTEFNLVVQLFNPAMKDGNRENLMVKLPNQILNEFNFIGYPRISEDLELEWWISKDEYTELTGELPPQ